jgi:hypothetical protein
MNKYLEKIASRSDGVINSIFGFGDRLIGHSAGRAKTIHNSLKDAAHLGSGIPASTMRKAKELSDAASLASRNTRIRTALAVGGGVTAGYLGIHKYQQHKDEKIMQKILSNAQNNQVY